MSTFQYSSSSPKNSPAATRVTFTSGSNYKERANVLFEKLNTMKTNLEIQKHSKFSELVEQLRNLQNNMQSTAQEKQKEYDRIMGIINSLASQIKHQKNQMARHQKILENFIENANRESQNIFQKMTKQRENNQSAMEKLIDFKIESFVLKNKAVWLEQDILDFKPFREELEYLKKQIQAFYSAQGKETDKLKREISDQLDKQKQFLLKEMRRKDVDDIMEGIQTVQSQIRNRVTVMSEKREQFEKNVLQMIEEVVNSYIRDNDKFNKGL